MSWRIALNACPASSDGYMRARPQKRQVTEDVVKTRGLVLATFVLSAAAAIAQQQPQAVVVTVRPLTDDDIKLMRQDVQSAKEDIIKDTMQFTHAEGAT